MNTNNLVKFEDYELPKDKKYVRLELEWVIDRPIVSVINYHAFECSNLPDPVRVDMKDVIQDGNVFDECLEDLGRIASIFELWKGSYYIENGYIHGTYNQKGE